MQRWSLTCYVFFLYPNIILPAQFRTVLKSKLNIFFFPFIKSCHSWNRIYCLGHSAAPPAPHTALCCSSPSGRSGLSALPCTHAPWNAILWCSQSDLCMVTLTIKSPCCAASHRRGFLAAPHGCCVRLGVTPSGFFLWGCLCLLF